MYESRGDELGASGCRWLLVQARTKSGNEPGRQQADAMIIRDKDRDKSERLRLLPRREQELVVKAIYAPAANPAVPAEDRREARRRAKALSLLLGLGLRKRK